MIERIAAYITDWQIEKGNLQEEIRAVYQYGYMLMIEVFINIFISLLLGILSHRLIEVTVFLIFFIPLRGYAGGFHMKKAWQCIIVTNLMVLLAGIVSKSLSQAVPMLAWLVIEGLAGAIIVLLSPIDSPEKPLDNAEKKHFGRKARRICVLEMILNMFLLVCGFLKVACIGILAHGVLAVMLGIVVSEKSYFENSITVVKRHKM